MTHQIQCQNYHLLGSLQVQVVPLDNVWVGMVSSAASEVQPSLQVVLLMIYLTQCQTDQSSYVLHDEIFLEQGTVLVPHLAA